MVIPECRCRFIISWGRCQGRVFPQIPHLNKRKTSLEPAVKGAMMFLARAKPSPTRCTYYEARSSVVPVPASEKSTTGMTALSGLMTYLELMQVAGLRSSVERHVGLRECGQGWTDSQIVNAIADSAEPGRGRVGVRPGGPGEGRWILQDASRVDETCGMGRRERGALENRWRIERRRSVPSESAVFRYLERFHDAGEEAGREAHRAFIPSPNEALEGLHL